jgi:predicted dinucleotide-binding enzyme/DMSO/TMAO reductase YedYZ heme-binding membrane subunit
MEKNNSVELEPLRSIKDKFSSKIPTIAIIGTGNYGIALGRRLLGFGYEVVYGSRSPNIEYLRECFQDAPDVQGLYSVTSIVEAWTRADQFVFFAISASNAIYERVAAEIVQSLDERIINASKIVIEISNRTDGQKRDSIRESNAKRLQEIFNRNMDQFQKFYQINVVKAFNLMSASSTTSPLDSEFDKESLTSSYYRFVPIAGDEATSKDSVIQLCRKIGFEAYDYGSLKNSALKLEVSNMRTFSSWYRPSMISILFYFFNLIWMFWNAFFFPRKPHTFDEYLSKISFLSLINKTTGFTALQLLAYVYLAYIVASIYQLVYSTKYKKFPRFLASWLRMRKQLGLWSFMFATIHVVTVIFIVNPSYVNSWYQKPAANSTQFTKMTLNGELNVLTGIFAYIFYVVLALTSVNSIANSLNFSEWRFVQSKLGLTCLFVSLMHDVVMHARLLNERHEKNYSFVFLATRTKLHSIYVPLFVLVARLTLTYFKPLANRLKSIRNGAVVKTHTV